MGERSPWRRVIAEALDRRHAAAAVVFREIGVAMPA
jgi:hypothetical protein